MIRPHLKSQLIWTFLLAILAAPIVSADLNSAEIQKRLSALSLPEGWVPCAPNSGIIFQPCYAGEGADASDESYLAVMVRPTSDPKVQELQKKLSTGEAGKGAKFTHWTVSEISKDGACHTLNLQEDSGDKIRQTWCFGKKESFAITERGPQSVPASFRKTVITSAKAGWAR